MARPLKKETQLSNEIIKSQLKQSLNDYSYYLNQLPLYVTYYSKNNFLSTADVALNIANQVVGPESPYKFNKIFDCPLFKVSQYSLGTDDGDYGTEASGITSEAIIPPNLFQPLVDDLIIMWHEGSNSIFRVDSVEQSRIEGKTFYKISFHLHDVCNPLLLDDSQVYKEMRIVGDYRSLSKMAIVEKDKSELIDKIKNKLEDLKEHYCTLFFNKLVDNYVIGIENFDPKKAVYMYSWETAWFIQEQSVMKRFNDYRSTRVSYFLKYDAKLFESNFKKSIYHAFLEKDSSLFVNKYFDKAVMTKRFRVDPFFHYNSITLTPNYIDEAVVNLPGLSVENVIYNLREALNSELIPIDSNIGNEIFFFIRAYFRNVNMSIESVYENISKIFVNNNMIKFFYLPIVFFIMNRYLDNLILTEKQ